jgi:hypothetical protein
MTTSDRCPVCVTTGQPATHALLPSLIRDCLTRAAGADPSWLVVLEQYDAGRAQFPDPFTPRR